MAQNVSLSPSALTFCVASTASAAPPSQTINVTTSTGGAFFTTGSSTSNWLQVTPASGTATSSSSVPLTVSIIPSQLGSGTTQTGKVQVSSSGEVDAQVTVEIGQSGCTPTQGGTLTPSTTTIALNSGTTTSQLSLAGSGSVSYSAAGGSPLFFTINGSSVPTGTLTLPLSTPLAIALNSNVSTTSSYSGSIVFTQGSTSATVFVTYTGSGGGGGSGTLSATPPSVALTYTAQTGSVTINGSGTASISASAPGGAQWFFITGTGISSVNNTNNVSLPLQVGIQLTPGIADPTQNYTGTITVTQGNTVLAITVAYTGSLSSITASPTRIDLTSATPVGLSLTGSGQANIVTNSGPSPNPANWFTVSTGSGSGSLTLSAQPTQVFVALSSSVSASTKYTGGFIQVTQGSTTLYIPVTYIPSGSGGNGSVSYDNAPTFNISSGTTADQTQFVTISGLNNNFTATAQTTNGPTGWLSVNTSSLTSLNPLTVTVHPTNLTTGTYNGTISISQNGVTVLNIPVTVIVGGTPTLTVTPATLNFVYQIGGTASSAQNISVSSPAGTQVIFTPTVTTTGNCGNWLVVPSSGVQTSTNGISPSLVAVQINTAVLSATSPSSCTGTITISAPNASNQSSQVQVSLTVSNNPLFQASPTSVSFTAQSTTTVPASQQVVVNSTGAALPFTYVINPSGAGGVIFASVAATAATTNSTLTVSVIPSIFASLTPGTYTNNIVLTSTAAGTPTLVIPVTLNVGTTLTANPTALVLNYQIGQIQPPAQIIQVSSTGAPITFTDSVLSSTCSNIISVTPTSGTTVQSQGQTGTPLTVQANNLSGFLNPQTCTATIDILASNSSIPVAVNVTVNIVNTAVINVGTQSIVQTVNSSAPVAQTTSVSLTSSDNGSTQISFTATAATNPAGQTWLTVSPNSGATPSNLQIRTDPANLVPGVYTGAITVTSATAVPVETIPVTFIVAAQATLSASSLTFTIPQGGSNPAAQTITVGGVPFNTSVSATAGTTSCGTGWLTASASGTTVTVGINGTGLTQGTCSGLVTIIVPGASNSPLSVPVTVTVASPIPLTLSTTSLTFNSNLGATTTPSSQTVQLSAAANAVVTFAATATTQSGGNWLTVSPTTGTTPATLTIGIAQSVLNGLPAGTYTGAVTVTSPASAIMTVNVSLVVAATPPPTVTNIVNAATQLPGAVAPGELITLYGTNLGPSPAANLQLTANGTVPTTLGNVQVMFDSTPAPLIYVGPNQINAIVPFEVAGRFQTTITVLYGGLVSSAIQQSVTTTSPGIFTANSSGSGPGAILNQDYSYNTTDAPAVKGSVISIYATGAGLLSPAAATGSVTGTTPPFALTSPVTVTFQVTQNGSTTTVPANVLYSGAAPGLVSGAIQVNVVVPAAVPSGAQTVILQVGGNSSPATVTVQVK